MQHNIELKPTGTNILIFDLETDGLDIEKCNIKSFHAYSEPENKYYNLFFDDDEDKIKNILDTHNVYATYNGDNFDIPIISRVFKTRYYKVKSIDLLKIIKKRGTLLKYGGFKNNRLVNIAKELKLKNKKEEGFDYEMLKKDSFTEEEKKLIIKYGQQDIEVTKELYYYLYKYFEFYKEYLHEKDIKSWSWLMSSAGTYAYKVICHLSGIPEEWPRDDEPIQGVEFEGGYVSTPSGELETGNLYCLDFASAYPHSAMMLNLFGYNCDCCSEDEKYSGGKLFNLHGKYCSKKLSPISKTIQDLYVLRVKYKKEKDPREVALKIILNTMYGICSNPVFKNVFNLNTAQDFTLFTRESLKYARKIFAEKGYDVIYGDTDSVYLRDVYNDEDKLMAVKTAIMDTIKQSVPFPQDTFDMDIDDKIKLMYFPNLKKKNYLYVRTNNTIKIKGLPFMKHNASPISMLIFNKYIKKDIIDNATVRHEKENVKKWISDEVAANMELTMITFNAKKLDEYKCKTTLYYAIAEKYGPGLIQLIPNNAGIGVGKNKNYCTLDEYNKNNLKISDINLNKTYSELNIFSDELLEVENIKIDKKNTLLSTWLK